MERLPLETQTLYAEFSERLLATQARRSLVQAPGCFTTKRVKGEQYIYCTKPTRALLIADQNADLPYRI